MSRALEDFRKHFDRKSTIVLVNHDWRCAINFGGDTIIHVSTDDTDGNENELKVNLVAIRKRARGSNAIYKVKRELMAFADKYRVSLFATADLVDGIDENYFDNYLFWQIPKPIGTATRSFKDRLKWGKILERLGCKIDYDDDTVFVYYNPKSSLPREMAAVLSDRLGWSL